jgi:competence protein ComK
MVNIEAEIMNDYEISKSTRAIEVAKEVGFSSRIYDRSGIYLQKQRQSI